MKSADQHLKSIKTGIKQWLRPDNADLQHAIEKTVDEDLFSFEDIKHQLLALKQSLTSDNIDRWITKSDVIPNSLQNRTVLCLHAGNLPLVGLQDFLAVLISGANYKGKLSRKDPYLLPSLIRSFEEKQDLQKIGYSTGLNSFFGAGVDAWMFSGSQNNASAVKDILLKNDMISTITPSLIRTAFFSAAFVDKIDEETMRDLTEAVFRYGGSGCRSVALVVSPFKLNDIKCEFTDYIESFWLKNPQHQSPANDLVHRFALNKALGINQAWLNNFLIEEGEEIPRNKFILKWIQGDFSSFSEILIKNSTGLQSAYSTANYIGKVAGSTIVEPLSAAQKPPVWWKPDGTDTLEWLKKNLL
jgi:hypothetical protein